MRLWLSFWRLRLWRWWIEQRHPSVRAWDFDEPEPPPRMRWKPILVALAIVAPFWLVVGLVWWAL